MKKKILSLLLALTLVFGVFIPVSTIDTSAAGAIYSVIDDVKTYEVDTYDELKTALTANEKQRVIVLTGDIEVKNSTQDISITPNLASKKIVLDLNGYDISLASSAYLFRSIFTIDQAGWFHIINTKFDGTNNYSELSIKSDYGSVLLIKNEQAEITVMSGINLKSDNVGLNISACHRLYMYGVDITTDYTGIFFTEKEKDIFAQAWFSFNDVVITSGSNCVDLRGIPELDIYSIDIDFNHVILKSSTAAIISKQTQLTPKDFKHAKSSDPVYTYNNGHSTEPILYATLEDLRTDRDIAYYNNPFMGNGTACAHSNKSDFLVTTRGHIVRCNDCFAYTKYTSHSGTKTAMPPSSYGIGYTSGIDCSCGYVTYYELPADAAIDPFSGVIEVDTWDEIKAAAANPAATRVKLTADITKTDHNNKLTIAPSTRGEFVIDLNGHSINVNSNNTQYLFDLSRATYGELGTHLAIVDSTDMGGGDVFFTTTQKGASVVNLAHKANSLSVIRATINLGSATDNSLNTTDTWAQTFAIDCKAAHMLNIYTAEVNNYKQNGTSIRFVMDATDVFKNTTVRIYRSSFDFKTFGLDFDNDVIIKSNSFKDFTISNNNTFTPLNSTARVMTVNGSTNTATLGDIVDADYHFVDGTYSVAPTKTLAYSNFDAGKEYWTEWRWNSSIVCSHKDFVSVLHAVFGDYQYCTRCKKGFAEDHHIVVDNERTTYADCTQDGEIFYICDDPGCGYEYSVKETAKGHIPNTDDEGDDIIFRASPATCTDSGISADYFECFVCREFVLLETGEIVNEEDLMIEPTGHDYKFIEKHNATCTSSGAKYNYWICAVCHNYFVTDAKTPISLHEFTKNIYLPKLSHKLTAVGANPATCTTDGNIAHYKCTRENCGMLFSDSEGKNEITTVKVPATGHNLQKVAAVKPTCTVNGNVEHYKCTVCNTLFSDAAGKTAITDTTVKATGHSYEWVVTKPAEVGKPGEQAYTCKVCKDVKEKKTIPALEAEYMLGDVDFNKKVDATDARLALRAAVGLEKLSDTAKKAADVDKNASVDATDARLILRAAVGLEKLK